MEIGREMEMGTRRGGQNDDFRPLTYTLWGGAWGAGTNV
jgi:hypothetical protein